MALASRTTWEIRPGGSANNGGGFNPGNATPGTDFSQQNSAQTTRTDLVIGAANTLTSVAFPFAASEVGNLIHITAGVNFTPGFYELVSISGSTVTLDRSPGTLAASGGTGQVGGALASPNTIAGILVAGNTVYYKGAFTTSSQWTLTDSGGNGTPISHLGYGTVRGDNGRPSVTASANLSPTISLTGTTTFFRNFVIDGANTADRGIDIGSFCYAENVQVTRCNLSGMRLNGDGVTGRRCLATFNGAGAGADGVGINVNEGAIAVECEAHDNTNGMGSANSDGVLLRCISHGNTLAGYYSFGTNPLKLINCVADRNTGDGLRYTGSNVMTSALIVNNLFTNNGGFGIRSFTTDYSGTVAAPLAQLFQNNGFFGNTSGNYSQVPHGVNDVILTADPYKNGASGDYSLNGTTGGGAAVLGLGIPGSFGLLGASALGSTSFVDIGAVQTQGAGAATSSTVTMRNLWRELTNQRDTQVVPDSVVDIYLDFGLQDFHRKTHYNVVTDSTSITLVAGQQEYVMPADAAEIVFVQYDNNRLLEKGSVEQWRRLGEDWRNENPGEPLFWAHYGGNNFVIRPKPSALAVANAPNLTIRSKQTPQSITTNGTGELPSLYWRLVVMFGAYLWSMCYPDSVVAQNRAAGLKAEYDAGVAAAIEDFARKDIAL